MLFIKLFLMFLCLLNKYINKYIQFVWFNEIAFIKKRIYNLLCFTFFAIRLIQIICFNDKLLFYSFTHRFTANYESHMFERGDSRFKVAC